MTGCTIHKCQVRQASIQHCSDRVCIIPLQYDLTFSISIQRIQTSNSETEIYRSNWATGVRILANSKLSTSFATARIDPSKLVMNLWALEMSGNSQRLKISATWS
jgi:hypothetical protein